jgi:hypothetical protein
MIVLRHCIVVFLGVYVGLGSVYPLGAADPVRISVTNQDISFLPAGVAWKKDYFKAGKN